MTRKADGCRGESGVLQIFAHLQLFVSELYLYQGCIPSYNQISMPAKKNIENKREQDASKVQDMRCSNR